MVSSLFLSIHFFSVHCEEAGARGSAECSLRSAFTICSAAGAIWDPHFSGAFLFVEEREVVEDEYGG